MLKENLDLPDVIQLLTMEENIIVVRQRTATIGRLSVITAITMLPVMSHGCLNAYLTVALPKFQQSNSTGFVLDFLQVSWIGGFRNKKNWISIQYCFLSSESEPTLLGVRSDVGWTDFWVVGKEKVPAGLQSPANIDNYCCPLLLILHQPPGRFDRPGIVKFNDPQSFFCLFVRDFFN